MATYCEILALHDERDTIISVDREAGVEGECAPIVLSVSDSTDNPNPIFARIMLTPAMALQLARALQLAEGNSTNRAY